MGKTPPQRITNAEDAHTTNHMSVREAPIEVITRGKRRHGIGSGLLYTWQGPLGRLHGAVAIGAA